jgi:hypothetical protein
LRAPTLYIMSPVLVVGERALNARLAEVCPVPPLEMPKVLMVIAKVPDDVTGVPATLINASDDDKPTEVTVPLVAGTAHVAVVPLDVKIRPDAPIARRVVVLTPSPKIRSPAAAIGLRASNAAALEVCPVPPDPMLKVPIVIANVPDVVTGEPLTVMKPFEEESPTLVTVPLVAGAAQTTFEPLYVSTLPDDAVPPTQAGMPPDDARIVLAAPIANAELVMPNEE